MSNIVQSTHVNFMQMPRTYLCRDYRIISRNEKLMKILFKGTTITSWDFRW